jgi:TonB family protein
MNVPLFRRVVFLISLFSVLVGAQDAPQPALMIQAANAASDLSSIGPYKLEAAIVWNRGTSDERMARLGLYQDHERFRWELRSGSYGEINVVLGNRSYRSRSAPGRLPALQGVPESYQIWRVSLSPLDKLGEPFKMELQGVQANCLAVASEDNTYRYCFDPSKNLLIESARTEPKKPKGPAIQETQYLDYQEIEGKLFPHAIRYLTPDKSPVEIKNIQVTRTQLEAGVFAIPANAREFETCDDMQLARLTKRAEPAYPQMARIAHIQGDVYFSAIIGTDGKLQDIKALSGHPILIQSALDAIREWRYRPAACGADLVAVETELRFQFHM